MHFALAMYSKGLQFKRHRGTFDPFLIGICLQNCATVGEVGLLINSEVKSDNVSSENVINQFAKVNTNECGSDISEKRKVVNVKYNKN